MGTTLLPAPRADKRMVQGLHDRLVQRYPLGTGAGGRAVSVMTGGEGRDSQSLGPQTEWLSGSYSLHPTECG